MDDLDINIIDILQKDGRASNAKIARGVGVSEGTIRRRLKKLIGDNTIQIVALPEPSKLGYTTEAMIALQVDPGKIEDVAAALSKSTQTVNVSITTGAFDDGEVITGSTSGAEYEYQKVSESNTDDGFAENTTIESAADDIIDFTETNPFGMP